MRHCWALLALVLSASVARADDPPPEPLAPGGEPLPEQPPDEQPPDEPPDEQPDEQPDEELGPVLFIERVDVEGNTVTQDDVVRRALPIQPGDALRASDKRLQKARFKVLALGFFRDVKVKLQKGSERGQVVLVITVIERGTIVLNRLWFGSNGLSPYWAGADLSERNLLGLGVSLGGGFIYAAGSDEVPGMRAQWAGELRFAVPSIRGSRLGASSSLTLVRGAEAFRTAGTKGTPELDELAAFPYRRFGWRGGLTYDVTGLTRVSGGLRWEGISAELPGAPAQTLEDGRVVGIDLHLEQGNSTVTALNLVFDRDTRPDPILSHSGSHVAIGAELGAPFSDYQFGTVFGRFEKFWPRHNEKHAIGLKIAGGVVLGNAPRFDRIHIADVDRMLTPRALGLVLSTASPLDILSTRPDKPTYGDLGGHVTLEYAIQLWRGPGKKRVYGSDLFFGAGLWGLGELKDLKTRDRSLYNSLPIDIYADAGIRLDTDVGIFELTIANALGRVR